MAYYTLLIVWLFITFMLFACVLLYGKILVTIDDLIRKRRYIQKQKDIDSMIEYLTSKVDYVESILESRRRKRR